MKTDLMKKVRSKKHYGIVTSVSWGIFTVISLLCVCGICLSRFDMPDEAVSAAVSFAVIMGGYITGYTFGRYNRRQGLLSGLKSGAVLFVITALLGIVYIRSISMWVLLKEAAFILLPAMIGGVIGANRKNFKAPM